MIEGKNCTPQSEGLVRSAVVEKVMPARAVVLSYVDHEGELKSENLLLLGLEVFRSGIPPTLEDAPSIFLSFDSCSPVAPLCFVVGLVTKTTKVPCQ